jgi:hypothetical protein
VQPRPHAPAPHAPTAHRRKATIVAVLLAALFVLPFLLWFASP